MTELLPGRKVFLVEDDPTETIKIIGALVSTGHFLVLSATDYKLALAVIPKLRDHQVTLAISDGNLGPMHSHEKEGKEIIRIIREDFPEIYTIGNSSAGSLGAHVEAHKQPGTLYNLLNNLRRGTIPPQVQEN